MRNTIATINQMQADGVLQRCVSRRHTATCDLARILRSKREFRRPQAAQPIVDKLALLDARRERALALHPCQPASEVSVLLERPLPYCVRGTQSA